MSEPKPKLDFSIYHPLDHWLWEARCREHYGGWQRHLDLAWHYHWKPELVWWIERPLYFVVCRFGHHKLETWWSRASGYQTGCDHCGYQREAYSDERFELPNQGEKAGDV